MPDERTTLKRAIDKYLKSLAPAVWYRKKWGGGNMEHEGDPDYTLCAWGRFGCIEAKHPVTRPKLEPAQVFTTRAIQRAGGFLIEAYDVSDVVVGLAAIHA